MDSIRINVNGDGDGELAAVVSEHGCTVVIDDGGGTLSIEILPEKLEAWCEVVSELASEHCRKATRHSAPWEAA